MSKISKTTKSSNTSNKPKVSLYEKLHSLVKGKDGK